jgi:uncharacterized membrane protein
MRPPSGALRLRLRIRQYFLAGLFVVIPVGVSLLGMVWFVVHMDRLMGPPVETFVGRHVPGIGLLALILLILWAGWLASHFPGKILIELGEKAMNRVPGLGWMYRTIKQIVEAFSPGGAQAFKHVVLIEHPRPGSWCFGFVTKEVKLERGGIVEPMVVVYIPTNHFYLGDYLMVRKSEVQATSLSVQEGIQIALSAGAAVPERLRAAPPEKTKA